MVINYNFRLLNKEWLWKLRQKNIQEGKIVFFKVVGFWKNLIRQTIFTKIKSYQRHMLLSKLKEISARTDCRFPYGRTILRTTPKSKTGNNMPC